MHHLEHQFLYSLANIVTYEARDLYENYLNPSTPNMIKYQFSNIKTGFQNHQFKQISSKVKLF